MIQGPSNLVPSLPQLACLRWAHVLLYALMGKSRFGYSYQQNLVVIQYSVFSIKIRNIKDTAEQRKIKRHGIENLYVPDLRLGL